MKIAIKGRESRGKEVIQILESLGGINRMNHSGKYANYFYYISSDDNTIAWTCVRPQYMNVFTLEEFEKEFPFKVGDLCIYYSGFLNTEIIVKILGMVIRNDCIMYEVGHKDTTKAHSDIYKRRHTLKPYEEMKEERNITLTLDKAKEWYNKGGELKEVALLAYSEKELTKVELPKTWEEFCKNYPIKAGECWIGPQCFINVCNTDLDGRLCRNWIPSKKSAEAHIALIQLEQLRDCWRQGWKPDWNNEHQAKYCITHNQGFRIHILYTRRRFLSFSTIEMAEEFLKCFRDLIEKAGDLI